MSKSTIGLRRKGLAGLATATLTMGAVFAGAGIASADADFTFERVAGDTRYETSAEIGAEYGASTNAILASGEDGRYPDALGANYLSGQEDAPVFLTETDNLPAEVLAQLEANGVENITIVGGLLAVSQAVEDELVAEGFNVTREAGQTRWETNQEIIAAGGDADSTVGLVTTGNNFPDALAVGPLAYKGGHPIGLSDGTDMPDETIDAMKAAGVTQALVVGGPIAVPESVITELEAKGIEVLERLARTQTGQTNRSGTAAAVAEYAIENLGFTVEGVNVASGRAFGDGADALAGGPLTGKQNRPLLITENESVAGSATLQYLREHANTLSEGMMFGGPLAITNALKAELEAAAREVTGNQAYSASPSVATQVVAGDEVEVTFSGVDAANVDLRLVSCASVTTDANGNVSFADTNNDDVADTAPVAEFDITEVNGVSSAYGDSVNNAVPTDGSVTVTLEAQPNADGCAVLVAFDDADNDNLIDLNEANQPVDDFAVSGDLTAVSPSAINASPEFAERQYGANHTVTAQVQDDDADNVAVAGVPVRFTRYMMDVTDPRPAEFTTVCTGTPVDVQNTTTGANGAATYTFTAADPNASVDSPDTEFCINVEANIDGGTDYEANDTVGVSFSDDAAATDAVSITNPDGNEVNLVGTSQPVSVTVTDQFGNPVSGETVTFEIVRNYVDAGTADQTFTVTRTTDASGVASFTLQGADEAATDTVTATADGISDDVDVTWAEGVATVDGDDYSTLDAAIGAAEAGDEITATGDFVDGDDVRVNKSVTITGDDATLAGGFQVEADNVTISGFSVDADGSANVAVGNGTSTGTAFNVADGVENYTITGNAVTDARTGIYVNSTGTANGTLSNNTMTDVYVGIRAGGTGAVDISGNTIQVQDTSLEGVSFDNVNADVAGNTFNGEEDAVYVTFHATVPNSVKADVLADNTYNPAAELSADGTQIVEAD